MKKLILTLALFAGLSSLAEAQRYAYVDTEYILQNVPEYQAAQKDLDRFSEQWQNEVEERYEAIDRLYKAFQAEKVLLTDEMRQKREEEIVKKEKEARDLQRQRFGVEGDLFKKRQELIQPIQDKIFQAVKAVADGSGYAVMFDKGNQSNILYADPKYDRSDRVLARMGYKAGDNSSDEEAEEDGGNNDSGSTPASERQRK